MKFYVLKWRMVTRYIRCFDFRFVFYEVLQNIPKNVLGLKYIILFIGMFVLLQKKCAGSGLTLAQNWL